MTMKHFNLYKNNFFIEVADTCTAYFGAGNEPSVAWCNKYISG